MSNLRFAFTGGGTGGHVYPNVAIYEILKDKYPDADFLYLGTRAGAEAKIIPSLPQPIPFRTVPSRGLPQGLRSPRTLWAVLVILLGALRSFFMLRRFRPQVVIASGGYVSAPVLLAAALLRIKIFIHEQNAVPGRLNQLMARFATRIAIAFPSTAMFLPPRKTVMTGYPLRRSIVTPTARDIRSRLHIPEGNRVLLVCSGSMGARTINRALAEIVPDLLAMENLTVIVSTGKAYGHDYKAYDDTVGRLQAAGVAPEIEGRLIVREYFDPISDIYAIADLAVTRAGAGTIKELSTIGLPAVLIPKLDLPADHQILNAREMEKTGGARVINEEVRLRDRKRLLSVPEASLLAVIRDLLDNPRELRRMRKCLQQTAASDSAAQIVKEIESIIGCVEKTSGHQQRVNYLHEVESEVNHVLPMSTVLVGHSLLADIFLEHAPPGSLLAIRFLDPTHQQAALKRISGKVQVNGAPVLGWVPLQEKDQVRLDQLELVFASYTETVKSDGEEVESEEAPDTSGARSLLIHGAAILREAVGAALYGAGRTMDAFVAAWAIVRPVARIISGRDWRPSLHAAIRSSGQGNAVTPERQTVTSLTGMVMLAALTATLTGFLLAPRLAVWMLPGYPAAGLQAAVIAMLRLIFPAVLLSAMVTWQTSLMQATGRIRTEQISTLVFYLSAIAVLLFPGAADHPKRLGLALLTGLITQALFLAPVTLTAFRRLRIPWRLSGAFSRSATRRFSHQLAASAGDTLPLEGICLVSCFLASSMPAGAIAILHFAWVVLRIPLVITLRTVETLVLHGSSGGDAYIDGKRAKRLLLDGVAVLLSLLIPLAILVIILAQPMVSLLFERFRFDARSAVATALVLQFYAFGLPAWGLQRFASRFFAERLDRGQERLLNLISLIGTASLAALLSRSPLTFSGIALASSLAALALALPRFYLLVRNLRRDGVPFTLAELASPLTKIVPASVLMVLVIVQARFVFDHIRFRSPAVENLMLVVTLSFVGLSIYLLASLMLKNTAMLVFRRRPRHASVPLSMLPSGKFLDAVSRNPEAYRTEFRYKISLYISSSSWAVKNVGIKLIGLFREKSRLPFLLDVLADKRANGFMRRNALQALRDLQAWDDGIQAVVLNRLHDRYYEVRVAALQCLTAQMNHHDYPAWRPVFHRLLRRSSIEEKIAVLRLIARKGDHQDLPALEPFFLSSNSLVREELAEVLNAHFRRGLLNRDELRDSIGRILITSNNLSAEFRIKSIVQRILRDMESP